MKTLIDLHDYGSMPTENAATGLRPILFSAPMIRALLDGSKTQTRRAINRVNLFGQITEFGKSDTAGYDWTFRDARMLWNDLTNEQLLAACPHGRVGDRLYVKEPWQAWTEFDHLSPTEIPFGSGINYLANGNVWDAHRRSALHMPRWASRITLEITDVHVERLQEISELDCFAEGIHTWYGGDNKSYMLGAGNGVGIFGKPGSWKPKDSPQEAFKTLINSIIGDGIWEANPWVWVITFKRITP